MKIVSVQPADTVDGRELRRLKNRQAIIDAVVTLTVRGVTPTIKSIAEEADLSARSVYRHFDNLDDATELAGTQILEVVSGHLEAASGDLDPTPPLRDRCASIVAARFRLHDAIGALVRNVGRRGPDHTRATAEHSAAVQVVTDQVAALFAPEFEEVTPADRTLALTMIVALTSFEVVDQLLNAEGVSRAGVAEHLTQQVFVVFTGLGLTARS